MEGFLQSREAGQILLAELTHGAGQALELRIPGQAVADAAPLRPFHDLAVEPVEALAAAEVTRDALPDLLGPQERDLLSVPCLRGLIGVMNAIDFVEPVAPPVEDERLLVCADERGGWAFVFTDERSRVVQTGRLPFV